MDKDDGMAEAVVGLVREQVRAHPLAKLGGLLLRGALKEVHKKIDYSEYGGAPLLGVKGVCFITHGSSNMNAIKNALRVAAEFAERNINDKIAKEVAGLRSSVHVSG